MRVKAVCVAALMLTTFASASVAATEQASKTGCSAIPCGYISPVIIIDLPDAEQGLVELKKGADQVEMDGEVTYKFDVDREGFGAWDPNDPPEVTMRFTGKPAWLSASVEPRTFPVEMSPQHLQTDESNPTQPQADYEYTHPIKVTLEKNDRPIVAEKGKDSWRMGLYAKSSESGLYKPGFGYQEIEVAPSGYDVVRDKSEVEGTFARVDLSKSIMDNDMAVPFHNVEIDMDVLSEISVWSPTQFVFKAQDASNGQTLRHPDLWATVVDENGDVLYHTGFRHPHDGRLTLDYTFPDVGKYQILVGGRPTPTTLLTSTQWNPVTATFPITVERFGSPSYPDTYNATFYEPLQAFAGDPAGEQQFQKTIAFPVKDGAGEATLSAYLDGKAYLSPQSPPEGPAEVTVAVEDPSGETLEEATLDPTGSSAELSFEPSTTGQHQIRVTGVGIHPISYGVGATLGMHLKIPYDDPPKVDKDNVDHVESGIRTVEKGSVTFTLEGVDDVQPWKPAELHASVDAPGQLRELTLTTMSADGELGITTDVPEPASEIDLTYPFPEPGRFVVVVTAEPMPGTGASWQTMSAAFPVVVGDADAEQIEIPATYEASYEGVVDRVQGDHITPTTQYERYFPFPVHSGAQSATVGVALQEPAAGSFEVQLLNENGSIRDEAELDPTSPSATLSLEGARPVDHVVRVAGTAPVGTAFGVDVAVEYGDVMVVDNPLVEKVEESAPDVGGILPGFEAVAAIAVAAGAAVLLRRDQV